jgi:hypothetical protein
MSTWNTIREEIDWETFHNFINFNDKPTSRYTHPSHSNLKAFKIKFFLNELPIQTVLHKRNPKKYNNPNCQRCKTNPETNEHWTQCHTNNTNINSIIKDTITKILTKHHLNIPQNLKTLTTLLIPSNTYDKQENMITKGIITLHQSKMINKTINKKIKHTAAEIILHKISKAIYKQIWITRCQRTSRDQNKPNQQLSNITTSNKPIQPNTVTSDNSNVNNNYKSLQVEKRISIWTENFKNHNASPNSIATIQD